MAHRFEQVIARCQEVIATANQMFGMNMNPTIRIDIRGRTAGKAIRDAVVNRITGERTIRELTIRFNRDMVLGDGFDHIMNNTIPHEIAHLVCMVDPRRGKNHDRGWQRVCEVLGGNGKRCHNEKVKFAYGALVYVATCGTKVEVSKIRHTKIQRGMTYKLKTGGRLNRMCAWAPAGQEPVKKAA